MYVVKKAVLWKYHKLKNGEFTVKVRIAYYGSVAYLKTGLTSKMEHWDECAGMPMSNHPKFCELVRLIDEIFENIDLEIRLSKRNDVILGINELKKRLEGRPSGEMPKAQMKLFSFYDVIINELEEQGRVGTANLLAGNKSIFYKVFEGKDKLFTSFTDWDFKKSKLGLIP